MNSEPISYQTQIDLYTIVCALASGRPFTFTNSHQPQRTERDRTLAEADWAKLADSFRPYRSEELDR